AGDLNLCSGSRGRTADLAGPEALCASLHLGVELDVMLRRDAACVAAGRHAEDVGGPAAEEAHALPGQPLHLGRVDPLFEKDLFLGLGTAGAVVSDHAIRADDPVA